jgi:hypothetical protein
MFSEDELIETGLTQCIKAKLYYRGIFAIRGG